MPISDAAAREAIATVPAWYHTIDLAPGVTTPGYVDWRNYPKRLLPSSLTNIRALDVGTFDGFWAFELERRGAEVVAIDLAEHRDSDWPPVHRERLLAESETLSFELGKGFQVARDSLGSSARRIACNVLDVTAEVLGGPVGLAFIGTLLLHLRDPVRALENIRRVLVPGGQLVIVESIALRETLLNPRTPVARFDPAQNAFNWWLPNLRTLRDYLWVSGFVSIRRIGVLLRPPSRPEMSNWYAAFRAFAPDAGR